MCTFIYLVIYLKIAFKTQHKIWTSNGTWHTHTHAHTYCEISDTKINFLLPRLFLHTFCAVCFAAIPRVFRSFAFEFTLDLVLAGYVSFIKWIKICFNVERENCYTYSHNIHKCYTFLQGSKPTLRFQNFKSNLIAFGENRILKWAKLVIFQRKLIAPQQRHQREKKPLLMFTLIFGDFTSLLFLH